MFTNGARASRKVGYKRASRMLAFGCSLCSIPRCPRSVKRSTYFLLSGKFSCFFFPRRKHLKTFMVRGFIFLRHHTRRSNVFLPLRISVSHSRIDRTPWAIDPSRRQWGQNRDWVFSSCSSTAACLAPGLHESHLPFDVRRWTFGRLWGCRVGSALPVLSL